jgi:hypothetical protein
MTAVADMNIEAARCFRHACESNDSLEHTIYIGLRQAWLALAQQVERHTAEHPAKTERKTVPRKTVRHSRAKKAAPAHHQSQRRGAATRRGRLAA